MSKNSLPFGSRLIEEKESSINGNIKVVKSLGLGVYIQVEGLTQSGGVVEDVWQQTLKKVKKDCTKLLKIKNVLILGFGGGSAAMLVKKYWPNANIKGVDIDPVMVDLGKKHLGLKNVNVSIKDAEEFIEDSLKNNKKFDLILVDTYLGESFPVRFEKDDFIKLVKRSLSNGGVAVFNRLYWDEKRKLAHRFEEKLERIFEKVERFYPEANLMFICK
jgi:spermidine synthase